ncbi:hypothetical protein HRK28_16255 [Rathayibacter sp. VKM Ac-2835]|uniref:hypothetical protein n=1 Tax=Rathayibacter sp. VKM Ac-2835 TaxID=2739043 RepID=UPI0015640EDC|nr:hypothetical protein [Rathayibacter sp. VKM Ac-2835]NRG42466.1 hypothetical protein [Rathayibacter sp. VKM Ac-2835]
MSANALPSTSPSATAQSAKAPKAQSPGLNRTAGLYAYAYRLTLSESMSTAALHQAAVTLRSGSPRIVDEQSALEIARTEIGRRSVGRRAALLPASTTIGLREEDLVRSGFHRRLHGLPALERQCWLLRHTGGHDVEAIAGLLEITTAQVRSALSAAAAILVAGELAESGAEDPESAVS